MSREAAPLGLPAGSPVTGPEGEVAASPEVDRADPVSAVVTGIDGAADVLRARKEQGAKAAETAEGAGMVLPDSREPGFRLLAKVCVDPARGVQFEPHAGSAVEALPFAFHHGGRKREEGGEKKSEEGREKGVSEHVAGSSSWSGRSQGERDRGSKGE